MPDLSELTLEHFSDHVDEPFALRGTADDPEGPALEARLIEAVSLGQAPYEGQRAPFSLVFSGPADAILPQGIYRLGHEQLGTLELFIVPLEPKPDGSRYQAIFS